MRGYKGEVRQKFRIGLIQPNFRSGYFHHFYYGLSQKGDILWIFFYLVLFYKQENRIYQTKCQHIKAKIPPWESRRINQTEPRVEIREGNAILRVKGQESGLTSNLTFPPIEENAKKSYTIQEADSYTDNYYSASQTRSNPEVYRRNSKAKWKNTSW